MEELPAIPAGTRFTCTAGHYVGRAARDIHRSDRVVPASFADLQGDPIKMGDHLGVCGCGAWWGRFGSIHTTEGWVPELPEPLLRAANGLLADDEPGLETMLRHGLVRSTAAPAQP